MHRAWLLVAGAAFLSACVGETETNASEDEIRAEGSANDSSEVFDESQCESILKAAAEVVRREGLAATPRRLLLSVKDIQCLAYEVSMRDRANGQGERVPNPYDVLLPQLFSAARLGSRAGFGGPVTPPPPDGASRPACLTGPKLAGVDLHADVAAMPDDRMYCYTFRRMFEDYLGARPTMKGFIESGLRVTVKADGGVAYDDVLGVLNVQWDAKPEDLTRAILSRPTFARDRYNVRLDQKKTIGSGAYQDNQNHVKVGEMTIDGKIAEFVSEFPEAPLKVRLRVLSVSTESCYDYFTIRDGNGEELQKVCQNGQQNATGPADKNRNVGQGSTVDLPLQPKYSVTLFSDNSTPGGGFQAEYSIVLP